MWNVWWSIKNIFRQNKNYIGIRGLLICLVATNARDLKSEWDKVKKSIVLGNSFYKKNETYGWLNARLQYLHCESTGDAAVYS